MYFRVNLKIKKPTLAYCCFTWIAFIEFNNFTVAFLLIRKTWDGRFVGKIVCTPTTPPPTPSFCQGRGRVGLLGKRGCFCMKNKLRLSYLTKKKFINKNVFLCHN